MTTIDTGFSETAKERRAVEEDRMKAAAWLREQAKMRREPLTDRHITSWADAIARGLHVR